MLVAHAGAHKKELSNQNCVYNITYTDWMNKNPDIKVLENERRVKLARQERSQVNEMSNIKS